MRGSGGRGSSNTTCSRRRLGGPASSAAAQAPTGPPPTTHVQGRSHRAGQAAGQARSTTAEPQADARQRALGRRRQVEQQQPGLRGRPTPGAHRQRADQSVGEAHDAAAIHRAPCAKRSSSSGAPRSPGSEKLGEHRHIRSARLKPWPATGCNDCAALPISTVRCATNSSARVSIKG